MRCCIGDECRQVGVGEVGVVQEVISLEAEFQLHPLVDLGVFEDRKIELPEVRPDKRVPAFIPKVHGIYTTGELAICCRISSHQSARHRKSGQIKEVIWIAWVVYDLSHHVGPAKKLPAAVVVILEVVIEMEWLARLHGHDTVQSPTVGQPAPL